MTKGLLTASAVIELPTGIALLCRPSLVVKVLLGSALDSPAGVSLGRIAGAALVAWGVACWLAKDDVRSAAARGITAALTLYNFGTVLILSIAGVRAEASGIALWPAVLMHAAMCAWCVAAMIRRREQ
jgi:hypothetical protein